MWNDAQDDYNKHDNKALPKSFWYLKEGSRGIGSYAESVTREAYYTFGSIYGVLLAFYLTLLSFVGDKAVEMMVADEKKFKAVAVKSRSAPLLAERAMIQIEPMVMEQQQHQIANVVGKPVAIDGEKDPEDQNWDFDENKVPNNQPQTFGLGFRPEGFKQQGNNYAKENNVLTKNKQEAQDGEFNDTPHNRKIAKADTNIAQDDPIEFEEIKKNSDPNAQSRITNKDTKFDSNLEYDFDIVTKGRTSMKRNTFEGKPNDLEPKNVNLNSKEGDKKWSLPIRNKDDPREEKPDRDEIERPQTGVKKNKKKKEKEPQQEKPAPDFQDVDFSD